MFLGMLLGMFNMNREFLNLRAGGAIFAGLLSGMSPARSSRWNDVEKKKSGFFGELRHNSQEFRTPDQRQDSWSRLDFMFENGCVLQILQCNDSPNFLFCKYQPDFLMLLYLNLRFLLSCEPQTFLVSCTYQSGFLIVR